MEKEIILGIDLGTTTVKVVAVRASDEVVIGSWSRETKAIVTSDAGSLASEQDVNKIMSAVDSCMSEISPDLAARVTRIGVSGQMHGLVMWTKQSHSISDTNLSSSSLLSEDLSNRYMKLSSLYTWQDGRCSTEFLSSIPTPESHLRIATGFGCCTLFWLNRHEPGCLECYRCAGTVQDLLVTLLGDLEEPVMSDHNAASWGYFDPVTATWNTDLLSKTDFPIRLLPSVTEAGTRAGVTARCWHGIPAGTPVTAAMGDLQCYMLATRLSDTDAVINVGTSSQFTFLMPEGFTPSVDNIDKSSPVEYVPFFAGRYLSETASLNGGNVLAAFVDMLRDWLREFGFTLTDEEVWDKLSSFVDGEMNDDINNNEDEDCQTRLGERHCASNSSATKTTLLGKRHSAEDQSPAVVSLNKRHCAEAEERHSADNHLTVETTLLGERHSADRRGINVLGAVPSNTSLRTVFHSISAGIISNLRSMSPPSQQLVGLSRIIGSGGALARNSVMRKAVKDMYNLPLVINSKSDTGDSAVGAALAAARFL